MFPDPLSEFPPAQRKCYAQILVLVAAADGTLCREELATIEALMGRSMIHPEVRIDIRNLLDDPPQLANVIAKMDTKILKLALRDAALLAAVDGEYAEEELGIIKTLATAAEVEQDALKDLFDWIENGWGWHQQSLEMLKIK